MNHLSKSLIDKHPRMNAFLRKMLIAIDQHDHINRFVNWINQELSSLHPKKRNEIIERMAMEDANGYEEGLAEIAFAALWNHLKWDAEGNPNINGKTPDYQVYNKSEYFICDITVVRHNQFHHNIAITGGAQPFIVNGKPTNKLPRLTQPIQQAHRLSMKVLQKYNTYKEITDKVPLLIGLYIPSGESSLFLGDHQVKNALYGTYKINLANGTISHTPELVKTEHGDDKLMGIYASDEYENLCAVIICRDIYNYIENTECWKIAFEFTIYSNPLGIWNSEGNNPFCAQGFPFNGLFNEDSLVFNGGKSLEFY